MGKLIAILISLCIGSELLCTFVHQFLLGAPYHKFFLISPVFFMITESIFCVLFKGHNLSAKFTKNYMIYRACKLIATLALVIVLLIVAEHLEIGMYARIIVSYLILLAAETYIMVQATKTKKTVHE